LDVSKFTPGGYVAKAYLKDGDRVVAQSSVDLTIPEKPEWWGNTLGLSEQVPPPWTPVRVEGSSVLVWGREYKFPAGPFPGQIITLGQPFLASPVTLEVVTEEGPAEWDGGEVEVVSRTDTKAKLRAVGEGPRLKLTGEVEVEFDGLIRIDFTLFPRGAVELKRLSLRVPVRDENALYMKGLGASGWYAAALYEGAEGGPFDIQKRWFFSTDGWVWPDRFMNYVWVGGDEAGLSVSVDSDKNFYTHRYVEVVRKAGAREVVYTFVDAPYRLEEPLAYTVALHATPVKPLPQDPRRWHYGYQCGEEIKIYLDLGAACSYGLTKGPAWPEWTPTGRDHLRKLRENGLRAFPDYYTNLSTVEMPEFQLFGKEWETLPSTRWAWRNYTAVGVCARGSYADFLIWGLNKLMDEGIGGIYFDSGGTVPCVNVLHGCGYVGREGAVKPTLSLFEARETYKRIYTLFKSRDPDSFIFHHAVPISPLASFVDGATESEEWSPGNATIDDLKPDLVRFGFAMYHQYGIPYSFYPSLAVYGAPEQQIPFKDLLPVTLIHNVYPIAWGGTILDLKPVWKIMDEWRTSSRWIPYWRNTHLVRSFHKDVKVSMYLKEAEKKILLLVANVGKEPLAGELRLHLAPLGWSEENLRVTRLDEAAEAGLQGSALSVSLPGRSVQFYCLESP